MNEHTIQTQTVSWCNDDERIVDPIPVYECSRCGERSDERRCEQCNIFMARAEQDGCPECFAEVVEIEAVKDHDDQLIPVADYQPDGPSLAQRQETERQEISALRAAERAARKAQQEAASHVTRASDITIGDTLLIEDTIVPGSLLEVTVIDVITAGPDAIGLTPGAVVLVVDGHGLRVIVHDPHDTVRTKTGQPDSASLGDVAERFTTERDVPGLWGGSQAREFEVRVGFGDSFPYANVPVAAIKAIRGNMASPLGGFITSADARAYANAARSVAEHLPYDGGRREHDQDVSVTFTEVRHMYMNLTRWVKVQTGQDDGMPLVEVAVAERRDRTSHCSTFTDRAALLALADAADRAAAWLDTQYDTKVDG